jgi:hypothetical protein
MDREYTPHLAVVRTLGYVQQRRRWCVPVSHGPVGVAELSSALLRRIAADSRMIPTINTDRFNIE